jgi:hypothetical protein
MDNLINRWLDTSDGARLGAAPRPLPRGDKPLGYLDLEDVACCRCGASALGAPMTECTEKRGEGPPWEHEYRRTTGDPWRTTLNDTDLLEQAAYLATKAYSSLKTAAAFAECQGPDSYAAQLYREKSDKRLRLLAWTVKVIEARKAGK